MLKKMKSCFRVVKWTADNSISTNRQFYLELIFKIIGKFDLNIISPLMGGGEDEAGWDNNGKPGNQVATKSLPSHEIFGRNPIVITICLKFIY